MGNSAGQFLHLRIVPICKAPRARNRLRTPSRARSRIMMGTQVSQYLLAIPLRMNSHSHRWHTVVVPFTGTTPRLIRCLDIAMRALARIRSLRQDGQYICALRVPDVLIWFAQPFSTHRVILKPWASAGVPNKSVISGTAGGFAEAVDGSVAGRRFSGSERSSDSFLAAIQEGQQYALVLSSARTGR
jgi:hypothetical protein